MLEFYPHNVIMVLTKANEIHISVISFMIPLVYVLQSTVNCDLELLELWSICHVLPCLLQELQNRDRAPDSGVFGFQEGLLCRCRLLLSIVSICRLM